MDSTSAAPVDALPAAEEEAKPRRRWRLIAAGVVAAALALAAFTLLRPPRVESAPVTQGPAVESVYASGVVDFTRQARIAPVVTSPIRAVFVEEGQSVRAGQLLAELVDNPERAALLQAQAQAAQARALARRTEQLHAQGFASDAAWDDARQLHEAAEAAARAAQGRLADYRIRAPFAGRVMRRDAEPGDMAAPGQALFVIADPETLRITADVDERDAGRLNVGLDALVRADAFPNQEFAAQIAEITPQGDSTGRVFRARLRLDPDTVLRAGMTVEINIVLERRENALLAPTDAVRDDAVFVLEDGVARRRAVTFGVRGADLTEIRSGVRVGERVILNPPAGLKDGARVRAAR